MFAMESTSTVWVMSTDIDISVYSFYWDINYLATAAFSILILLTLGMIWILSLASLFYNLLIESPL